MVGFIREQDHVATRTSLSTPDLLLLHIDFADAFKSMAALSKQAGARVFVWSEATRHSGCRKIPADCGEILVIPDGSGEPQEESRQKTLVISHLRAACRTGPQAEAARREPEVSRIAVPGRRAGTRSRRRPQAVVIGSSTGGPVALTTLISMLPADFPLPVAIVQHMPTMFTSLLADRLNSISPLQICEGSHEMEFRSGRVVIGPGGLHMRLDAKGSTCRVLLDSGSPENSCRPAVDVLFRSAAAAFGGNVLAVVLTGMGKDGLLGAEQLHQLGSPVIVQDAATSTVWGMPGAIAQAGFADAVLPLPQIVPELMRYL